MTAAYYRSFESKHLYFLTGHARRRLSRCGGKRRIVLPDVRGRRGWFNLAYCNDQMTARAIGERTVDLLGSFDPSDSGQSSRYSVSLDVENEDSDWSFEVSVTVEF
jgi:hypothetical protein